MRIAVHYGRERHEYEVAAENLLSPPPAVAPPIADPAAAVRDALDHPFGYPALWQALTPDDHLVLVVDEALSHLGASVGAILEHVAAAGVPPENVTLLCAPSPDPRQAWLDDLPEQFQDARLEVHHPDDRNLLSYLATTREGKRLYMNRTLVDADQIVVLSGRRYDTLLGVGGAAGALYPALSDAATRDAMKERRNLAAPDARPWPTRTEAVETAWLLGAPFFVQVIEGSGDEWVHVVAGSVDASAEGERLLGSRWHRTVPRPADVVLAGVGGDPARQTFADLAAAAHAASRVVREGGRIVLLTQASPEFGPDAALLAEAGEPQEALKRLGKETAPEMIAARQWAEAASRARVYLLSGWPEERVEDLFATPLQNAAQAQRLIDAGGMLLVLDDAQKTVAVVQE
jgi:nickel-dependent lactate racemase